MDMESPEMSKLFDSSQILKEEFEAVICSFVFWEHLFKERTNENHVHAIMRTIFFREILLGIMRIWDNSSRNKTSLSMFRIGKYMGDKRITELLSERGGKNLNSLLDRMDDDLTAHLTPEMLTEQRAKMLTEQNDKIKEKSKIVKGIIDCYQKNKKDDLNKLKDIRDNIIAHRDIRFQPDSSGIVEIAKCLYADTSLIIQNLIDVLGCETWEIKKVEDLYRKQLKESRL